MMRTPQRELHHSISEISEGADVRAGSRVPLAPRWSTYAQLASFGFQNDQGVIYEIS
jgi:hypothetical protein